MSDPQQAMVERGRFWVLLFTLVSLAVIAAGVGYYRNEEQKARHASYRELAAISSLKARHIVKWRLDRLNDAQRISGDPLLRQVIAEWLKNRDEASRLSLRERFSLELIGGTYSDVLLLDPNGNTLLSLCEAEEDLSPETRHAVRTAVTERRATLSELFRASDRDPVYMDSIAPLTDPQERLLTFVVLRCSAEETFYPIVETWPTPSPSAETLLIKEDGESVLALNNIRHAPNSALILRRPLTDTQLPAVQAILGRRGLSVGVDYRGRQVLADLLPIPQSAWFMVAKIDMDEVMAGAHYRAIVAGLVVLLFILLSASVSAYGFRRRQSGLYENLYRIELAKRQAEEEFRSTLYGIGDAVITTDANGCVKLMNPVAERLTGYLEGEARGKPVEEIFHIVNEDTRSAAENPVQQVLRDGLVIGLANHTLLISRDGSERPIADSGAPIRLQTGESIGVVLVFRDQSEERAAEKALLESEARFRTLIHAMVEGVALHEMVYNENGEAADYRMVSVNPAYEKLIGVRAVEIVGKLASRIYGSSPPPYLEEYALVADTCRPITFDTYFKELDRHLHISVTSPMRGSFVTVFEDISERKRAETALQESEERYRQLFESESDAIFLIDDETGRILEANGAASALYGCSREDFLGKTYRDLYADPDGITLDSLVPKPVPPGHVVHIPLTAHRRKDDSVFPVEVSGRYFTLRNRPVHLAAIRDVTEKKLSEDMLRASEKRYRMIVETASEGIVAVDSGHRITFMNQVMRDLLGYEAEELIGKNWTALVPDDQLPASEARLRDLERGKGARYERKMRRKDGEIIWLIISSSPLVDELGVYHGAFAMLTDITQRKHADEAREALEAKLRQAQKLEAIGTLAGGIAHDFNNILAPIIGYAEMALNDTGLKNPPRHGLEQILQAAIRARDLVRQILAFGRFGKEQQRTPLEVSTIVHEALRLLRASLPSSIEMRQNVERAVILADATQIHQVLINLCANAAHAMDGRGVLEVALKKVMLSEADLADVAMADLKPGLYAKLSVCDTGTGMDPSVLQRIFDPYFTTKEVGKGSGLGLAVVHGIVKRHEGAVTVKSERGRGTTFDVYIPALEIEAGASAKNAEAVSGGTGSVLLVDDERAIIEVGTALLEHLGYSVSAATCGKDALEAFRANPGHFDLVITDYTMPGMTGAELCREIRQIRPDIPIMLCTGFSEKVTEDAAEKMGVRLVMKPFGMKQLAELVEKILGERKGKADG